MTQILEGIDQQNFLYIVGRDVNRYDCFGKQVGMASEI